MNKEQKAKLLRAMNIKAKNLLLLVRDHFNAEGWDTEENGKKASRLLDEIIDMATLARNELT
jgi:hypothetical protein